MPTEQRGWNQSRHCGRQADGLSRHTGANQVVKGAKCRLGPVASGDDDLFERRSGDVACGKNARQRSLTARIHHDLAVLALAGMVK